MKTLVILCALLYVATALKEDAGMSIEILNCVGALHAL